MLQFDILQVQFQEGKYPQPQQNSTKCWKITQLILSCKTSLARPSNTACYKTKRGRWSAMMVYAPTAKRERHWRRRRRTGDVHQTKNQNAFLHAFLRHFIRLSVSTVALLVGQNPEKNTSPCRKLFVHWTAEENNQFFPVAATPSKLVFCSSDYFQSVIQSM